jgi:hypothetical protein
MAALAKIVRASKIGTGKWLSGPSEDPFLGKCMVEDLVKNRKRRHSCESRSPDI